MSQRSTSADDTRTSITNLRRSLRREDQELAREQRFWAELELNTNPHLLLYKMSRELPTLKLPPKPTNDFRVIRKFRVSARDPNIRPKKVYTLSPEEILAIYDGHTAEDWWWAQHSHDVIDWGTGPTRSLSRYRQQYSPHDGTQHGVDFDIKWRRKTNFIPTQIIEIPMSTKQSTDLNHIKLLIQNGNIIHLYHAYRISD